MMIDVVWVFYGKRLARLLQSGNLASMAHVIREGKQRNVFTEGDWRTPCLTFVPLDVIHKIGKRKKAKQS